MKRFFKFIIAAVCIAGCTGMASAQYAQMVDQVGRMLGPALSGGFNYKGYVDASYLKGVGSKNADFVEITTTQGFRYADWFFMGVGAGVEAVFTNPKNTFSDWDNAGPGFNRGKSVSSTGWVVPLFTDFRFIIGSGQSIGFYIDLRLGASFLVNNTYLRIGDGYMTSSENFYVRPCVGMRIPLNISNPKQALNIGLAYQLITSNYWYYSSSRTSLSALGLNVGFEW